MLIGAKANTPLKTVLDTLHAIQLEISDISTFDYNSDLPADSVNYLKNILNQKPYIKTNGFTALVIYSKTESKIQFSFHGFNMTKANQDDFLGAVESLRLTERGANSGFILLKVMPGDEVSWVERLKKVSFVEYAEPNYVCENCLN